MTHLSPAQIYVATGKTFEAPGVLNGCSRVRFCGIYPSGNVGVKREADPESFGAVAVSAAKAAPLLEAIARRFTVRGYRSTTPWHKEQASGISTTKSVL